jgi:hypothetical protein
VKGLIYEPSFARWAVWWSLPFVVVIAATAVVMLFSR